MTSAGVLASGQHDDYGFGWMLGTYGSQPTVWHNGGTFGFLALNARLPKTSLMQCCMCSCRCQSSRAPRAKIPLCGREP